MSLQKILLVEDDPDVQEVAGLTLSEIGGFEIKVCSSATEALEVVGSFRPDLVLMDVMMPGLNGLDALARLKANAATAPIPVVLMTARTQPRELAHYRELGCIDVITKPFDPASLPERLREMWNSHRG